MLTATGPIERLDDMVADAAKWASDIVDWRASVLDLYAWSAGPLGDADELAGAIRDTLDASPLPATVRRVVVVAGHVGSERMRGSLRRGTAFRWWSPGFPRGRVPSRVAPRCATPLRLSQLRELHDRAPSPLATTSTCSTPRAHDNPDDERLFALAEVHDLTAVHDDTGHVVALPQLESDLFKALAVLRQFQAPRPPRRHLQ